MWTEIQTWVNGIVEMGDDVYNFWLEKIDVDF